jgi:hypothetical protein
VFLVQILRKLRKIHSEVHIQGKKISENAFRILKSRAKTEIRGGGKESWGWEEKISILPQMHSERFSQSLLHFFIHLGQQPKEKNQCTDDAGAYRKKSRFPSSSLLTRNNGVHHTSL